MAESNANDPNKPSTAKQTGGADANQNPPPITPPQAERRRGPNFAFVVEFAGAHNENIMCPIDQRVYRGRWSRSNLTRTGTQVEGDFASMPDLPGMCLLVNTAQNIVRMFDPLKDEVNAKLLARAQRIALAVTGVKMTPEKGRVWRDGTATDNLKKTFVFWVRRLLDVNLVRVVRGKVPEWAEIQKLPGMIQLRQYDKVAGLNRGVPDAQIPYEKPAVDDDDGDERYTDDILEPVVSAPGDDYDD